MCGIAGYVGPKNAVEVVFDELKRLEYRGYDSAGLCYSNDGELHIVKRAGKLGVLGGLLSELHPVSHAAMAHSRWATHGAPTDANSHPHLDQSGHVAVVHNGIIENYLELADDLRRRGHVFLSETDTEVAAHVIGEEYALSNDPLEEAVRRATTKLRGAFAMVVQSSREPGKLVAVRSASPLVLGVGKGEQFLASDIPALLPYTRQVLVLEEGCVAALTATEIQIQDRDGRPVPLQTSHIAWDAAAAERGGFEHFLMKEIMEQPEVIRNSLAGRLTAEDSIRLEGLFSDHVWNEIDRVNLIGCGTAFHAALLGKHLFEKLLRLPTDVYYSSEFRYGDPVLSPKSLAIFVSQSGETADTLAALRLCKSRRIRTLGIVNVVGSSIARECDRTFVTQAGPEISVASTKAYTAQVIALTLLALHTVRIQETPGVLLSSWVQDLRRMPDVARTVLECEPGVRDLAKDVQGMPLCFFLGRGADAYVGLEAALKMKEISYVPTQESPAGEMKHGPLALVVPGVVAVFICNDGDVVDKIVSNMREVQARGGVAVCVTTDVTGIIERAADRVITLPAMKHGFLNSLLSVIPLQLLAYHVAKLRGCDIDQPRNLAKSVTVE